MTTTIAITPAYPSGTSTVADCEHALGDIGERARRNGWEYGLGGYADRWLDRLLLLRKPSRTPITEGETP